MEYIRSRGLFVYFGNIHTHFEGPMDINLLKQRWFSTWNHAGAVGNPSLIWRNIEKQYSEPHRHYHTLSHIHHCLNQLEVVWRDVSDPYLISWALWFHDYFYSLKNTSNERHSANMSMRTAQSAKLPTQFMFSTGWLVFATKKHRIIPRKGVSETDMAIMLDIDLSILGKPWKQYDEYRKNIRQEYVKVPWGIYAPKRAGILSNFLKRPQLFYFPFFFDQYEQQARTNLEREIEFLAYKGVGHEVSSIG